MSDIQATWLENEASRRSAPEEFFHGAKLLQDKISNWILAIQGEGIASPYALSAMWELTERIEEWCGGSNSAINTKISE